MASPQKTRFLPAETIKQDDLVETFRRSPGGQAKLGFNSRCTGFVNQLWKKISRLSHPALTQQPDRILDELFRARRKPGSVTACRAIPGDFARFPSEYQ